MGNPPFLGHVPFRETLGGDYADKVHALYGARISNFSDLCCYWFEKAREQIAAGVTKRTGLLATQTIRSQSSRPVLRRIKETGDIFQAISDRNWVLEGAAVHISIVCFDDGSDVDRSLDGTPVSSINSDLTAGIDLTRAQRLAANSGIAFQGVTKVGDFDISEDVALAMMAQGNPHGRPNSDVIRRWINGADITQRSRNMWIIDFGDMPLEQAALYEAPFEHINAHVRPQRERSRSTISNWWLHERPRPNMQQALAPLERYIATPKVAKHRFFVWLSTEMLPSNLVIAVASDDDYMIGVLSSSVHELWARQVGSQLREAGSGGTYTPTTCFETFPFPRPTEEQRETIGVIAAELNQLREGWLNPDGVSAAELKRRTLTNLYNQRPTWLDNIHTRLDGAVADAYGWPANLAGGEILERLLTLNLERAEA